MAKRTINDAVFIFADADGRTVYAQRGETVDIPAGPDLERGDNSPSAFTEKVGEEPAPVEGSFIPKIEADWSPEEMNRWVRSGKEKEILAHLEQVAPSQRASIAQRIIEAEHATRGEKARQRLLNALAGVTNDVPEVETEPEATPETDLEGFVQDNNIPAVLKYVGDDKEKAQSVLAIEVGAAEPRKKLVDSLNKLLEG